MKLSYLVIAVVAIAVGWSASHFWPHEQVAEASRKVLFYQSPMHPWVKSDKPGQCTVCGMDLVPIYEGGKNYDHAASNIVMLPPGSPNVVGVQTIEVKKKTLVRSLRVSGMIGEDESRHGIISAPVEGRIDGLPMSCDGQQVARRQPYATIFSRTLLNAADDYKKALKIGGPDLEAARKRLELFGLVSEQIESIPTRQENDIHFGILAPLSGTIVKSYVSEGQYVKEGDKLFEVADFTRMSFMFTVYEADVPYLRAGQFIEITTPSLPGQTLKARMGSINPNLDEMTRSTRVRVVVENPDRRIKNRAFAQAVIQIDAPEVLSVPRSAVLWPGNMPRVFVEKESGSYEQRNVKLGRAGDLCWEVFDGLKEDERVVVSGTMLIDSQAQLDQELHAPAADIK